MAELISGKEISKQIYSELKGRIDVLKAGGVTPGIAVLIVGDDPASLVYANQKKEICRELGMRSSIIHLPSDTSQKEVLSEIDQLNSNPLVHGFMVQFPLPPQLDEAEVVNAIDPRKDIDCLNPVNVGRILLGEPGFLPATPAGIRQLLSRSGVDVSGKHVVIVGRSNIVGKPMAAMLMQRGEGANATVTVVHSGTEDLPSYTRRADVLIVAVGRPGFITADMVGEGAVVIDVGTNRIEDPTHPKGSRLVGDVDFDSVSQVSSKITPVPGGVGPMTICMLVSNVVAAAERFMEEDSKC